MNRRDFLATIGAGAAAATLRPAPFGQAAGTTTSPARRPNVIFIYTDDHEMTEVGCYGGQVLTPHMDSLAKDGVQFMRAYISSPVCTPSRYSALTGRYATRSLGLQRGCPPGTVARIAWNSSLAGHERTVAHLLRAAGYATGTVGKWHITPGAGSHAVAADADPADKDVQAAIKANYEEIVEGIRRAGGLDYAASIYTGNIDGLRLPKSMKYHNMEWITKGALDFIEANKARPFFLHIATTVPHSPNPLVSMQQDPRITPAGMLDAPPRVQPSRESVLKRARDAGVTERRAAITWVDDGVGAVLKRLEELGLAEDTLVILASDNQKRSKYTCYEGALTPFLVRWARRARGGRRCAQLVSNIDITPTVLDVCGLTPPADYVIDGRSFAPLLTADQPSWRDSILLQMAYARAVVTDEWKYIAHRFPPAIEAKLASGELKRASLRGEDAYYYESDKAFPGFFDRDQLYNLKQDPKEQHNLAADPQHKGILAEMKGRLKAHLAPLPHVFGEFKS